VRGFIVDLETAPRDNAAEFLEMPEAPSNYKAADKISAYIEERRAKQLEMAALSAETARILCIGILREESGVGFIYDDNEAALLTRTWEELGSYHDDEVFVTFCGTRFDWPMLIRRSYVLGIRIPGFVPLDGRWKNNRHTDVAELWSAGDRTCTISLDRLSRLCGLPGKSSNGSEFGKLWVTDRKAALSYLENDLRLTEALWRRMR
jgi:hypothetical protein